MNWQHEIHSIISGIGKSPAKNLIETATCVLRKSKGTGSYAQKNQFSKNDEAAWLIQWIEENKLWFTTLDVNRYLTRGAEQRVYLQQDGLNVIKLNDSVFYEFWEGYFHSLLIYNFLFPNTAYELLGFYQEEEILHAVIRQKFIKITEPTNSDLINDFLCSNGFILKKNHDYFHPQAGIILEDLHDENVLTNHGVLFFIDTVIYLSKKQNNN